MKENFYIWITNNPFMNTRIIVYSLLLSLLITSVSFSQERELDGIYTPGTSQTMTAMNVEPICWVNANNEFNAYIPGENPILLTIQNDVKPDLGKLPQFKTVFITAYSFVLTSTDDKRYYFGVESNEEKQMKEILKNMGSDFVKTDYGYGFAQHTVKDESLKKLKAAKSVYDVLGK